MYRKSLKKLDEIYSSGAAAAGKSGGMTEGMVGMAAAGGIGIGASQMAAPNVQEKMGFRGEGMLGAAADATARTGMLMAGSDPRPMGAPDVRGDSGSFGPSAGGILAFGGLAAGGGAAGFSAISDNISTSSSTAKMPFRTKGSGFWNGVRRGGNLAYSKVGANSRGLMKFGGAMVGASMAVGLGERMLSGLANKVAASGTPQSRQQRDPREQTAQTKSGSANPSRMSEYGGGGGAGMSQPTGSMVLDLHRSGGKGAVLT